jgi:hypothetical protein
MRHTLPFVHGAGPPLLVQKPLYWHTVSTLAAAATAALDTGSL